MKLKITLQRSGGAASDLEITLEPTVTVGSLATSLARRDPESPRDASANKEMTLSLLADAGGSLTLAPGTSIVDASLRSGAVISLVAAPPEDEGVATAPQVGLLRVLSGPDAGREFAIARGTTTIGRDASCDVCISDPLVSKQHAKLQVGGSVELIDTNSSNGIQVAGETVQRVALRAGEVALIGDSEISVTLFGGTAEVAAGQGAPSTTATEFNRPPRTSPFFKGDEFSAPEPPARTAKGRLPILPMIIPLVMGAVLYLVTHSVLSIAFIALSPLMLVGNYFEGQITANRNYDRALEEFRTGLVALERALSDSATREVAIRTSEQPSVAEVLEAAAGLTALLWTRRPSEDGFLQLRLGLATCPTRTKVVLPRDEALSRAAGPELIEVLARHQVVGAVPVVADLRSLRALGISGDEAASLDVARGLLVQLVGLHSPAEVVVTAVASAASAPHWDWLKWLPHVSSSSSPIATAELAIGRSAGIALVGELDELVASRAAAKSDDVALGPAVILVVEDDAPVERARLIGLTERGSEHGVHVLWRAPSTSQLPAACRLHVDVDGQGGCRAVLVDEGSIVELEGVERVSGQRATTFARRLSPLVDAAALLDDASDLPGAMSFLALVGPEVAGSPDAVIERWRESNSITDRSGGPRRRRSKDAGLRSALGQSATDPFHLDLRTNGPHALVGGTTGAGKSELLQSWIVSMAAAHSPDRVTFFLVDYKGGSAFGDCKDLPHTVGMVTDLSPHLARRALTSLVAELRYREHILNAKRAKDLLALERTGDPETPPSLVIVVDEFAALVQELPEFVDGVVNVAQRGRSLGLHLILATQRPAGVIKDNLRANTNLRIALRMADEADSTDVLGVPVAGGFDPGIPGRAAAKLGPGRLISFQTAYAGGWTTDEPPPPPMTVEELTFGTPRSWEEPEDADSAAIVATAEPGPTDIRRVVDNLARAAELAQIPEPRKPWLPDLAQIYDLAELPGTGKDSEIVFGVRDEPERQEQPLAVFYPDRDGNMVIYGTGGSGKSAALRTLAIAAGMARDNGPCEVYGLDFGARGLHMLEELPHVGSIISAGDDPERVARLLRELRTTIDERASRYAKVRAGTVSEYRSLSGKVDETRILVLVDGMAAFRQAYEVGDKGRWFETFLGIAADGRPVGVHLVVTADRGAALPSSLGSTMQRRIVLRMADENELAMLGAPSDGFDSESAPGRGYQDSSELQIAVLGATSNLAEQAAAVSQLAASMREAKVPDAHPIGRLAEVVRLSELPAEVEGRPVIGLAEDTLGPFAFNPAGTLVVAGPPASGRTTTIATIAAAVRRAHPEARLVLLGQPRSQLAGLLDWAAAGTGPDESAEAAAKATAMIVSEEEGAPKVVVIVEALPDFLNTSADGPIQELARACFSRGQLFVSEGETGALSGSWPLIQAAKISRCGIALQPDQTDGAAVFRTNFPRVARGDFTVGRGLFVTAGRTQIIQMALPD